MAEENKVISDSIKENKIDSKVKAEVEKILLNDFGNVAGGPSKMVSSSTKKGNDPVSRLDSSGYGKKTNENLSSFKPLKGVSLPISTRSQKLSDAKGRQSTSSEEQSARTNTEYDEQQEMDQARELEQDKQKSKSKIDSKIKAKTDEDSGEKPIASRLFFDNLLKNAWLDAIPTFTLSVFWVYAHAVLSLISPKFFCKLGQEWVPQEIKKTSPKKAKEIGGKISVIEKGATGCCCFLHLFIIVIAFLMMLLTPPISFFIAPYIAWEWISQFFK